MASFFGTAGADVITPRFVSAGVQRLPALARPGVAADYVEGGDGADLIDGGGGADTLLAGAGNDTVLARSGAATVDGGGGVDRIDLTAFAGGCTLDLATGLSGVAGEAFLGFENATGGAGDDSITGSAAQNFISGAGGDDTIKAGGGADDIAGGDGADSLDGGSGDDFLSGGAGDDLLRGGGGENILYAGAGDDTIFSSWRGKAYGEAGDDAIHAGAAGPETLDGGAGTDLIDLAQRSGGVLLFLVGGQTGVAGESFANFEHVLGSGGADTITGSNGANRIETRGGADSVSAADGADTVLGGAGDDTLDGSTGADSLSGGDGADHLVGAIGVDTLEGGGGADRFRYGSHFHSFAGAADVIAGFARGADRIDLSAIDANGSGAGNGAFVFRGVLTDAQGLAFGAGSLWLVASGTETVVRGAVNADSAVDLEIRIQDGATAAGAYAASDFIL